MCTKVLPTSLHLASLWADNSMGSLWVALDMDTDMDMNMAVDVEVDVEVDMA